MGVLELFTGVNPDIVTYKESEEALQRALKPEFYQTAPDYIAKFAAETSDVLLRAQLDQAYAAIDNARTDLERAKAIDAFERQLNQAKEQHIKNIEALHAKVDWSQTKETYQNSVEYKDLEFAIKHMLVTFFWVDIDDNFFNVATIQSLDLHKIKTFLISEDHTINHEEALIIHLLNFLEPKSGNNDKKSLFLQEGNQSYYGGDSVDIDKGIESRILQFADSLVAPNQFENAFWDNTHYLYVAGMVLGEIERIEDAQERAKMRKKHSVYIDDLMQNRRNRFADKVRNYFESLDVYDHVIVYGGYYHFLVEDRIGKNSGALRITGKYVYKSINANLSRDESFELSKAYFKQALDVLGEHEIGFSGADSLYSAARNYDSTMSDFKEGNSQFMLGKGLGLGELIRREKMYARLLEDGNLWAVLKQIRHKKPKWSRSPRKLVFDKSPAHTEEPNDKVFETVFMNKENFGKVEKIYNKIYPGG
jgi:hypothetical protein